MSGRLRLYKDKLDGYKKFYGLVKTIKMVTLARYQQSVVRVKTRDASIRFTEKAFGQYIEESVAIKQAKGAMVYVPVCTNRGSCGSLNSNAVSYIEDVNSDKAKIISIGKKGNDSFFRLFPNIFHLGIINDMKQPMHFGYASYVYETAFSVPNAERVQIIFNRYISAGIQRQCLYNIPSFESWKEKLEEDASSNEENSRYVFANALLNTEDTLIRDFHEFHGCLAILNAVLENELSEQAARIVAVEGQLSNINSLQLQTLQLYNKTRQGSITASLIEILSAMNAMEGNAVKGVKLTKFWQK